MSTSEYTVFVAEDEPRLLRSLTAKLEKADPDFRVIGTAMDGRTALEEIEKLRPDLLVTDIKMPEKNGLELIEEILEIDPDLTIVIVSGYNDFELIRKALNLRVKDYLLKPVTESDVSALLEEVKKELTEKREQSEIHRLEQIFYGTAESDETPLRLSAARYTAGLLCLGNYLVSPGYGDRERTEELRRFWQELGSREWTIRNRKVCPLVFPDPDRANQGVLLIREEGIIVPPEEIFGALFDELAEGDVHTTPTLLYFSRSEKLENLRECRSVLGRGIRGAVCPGESRMVPLPRTGEPDGTVFLPPETLKELALQALFNKKEAFGNSLKEALTRILTGNRTQKSILRALESLIGELAAVTRSDAAPLKEEAEKLLSVTPEGGELTDILAGKMTDFFTEGETELSPKEIVRLTAAYMDERFMTDISLSAVSDALGYDISYLTKIFTRERGISPKAYLIGRRIETAGEYFRKYPDLSIQEVALRVGYGDAHYFSRIFRKQTGLSPSQYIKREGVAGSGIRRAAPRVRPQDGRNPAEARPAPQGGRAPESDRSGKVIQTG